jgi:hypothetical protein
MIGKKQESVQNRNSSIIEISLQEFAKTTEKSLLPKMKKEIIIISKRKKI